MRSIRRALKDVYFRLWKPETRAQRYSRFGKASDLRDAIRAEQDPQHTVDLATRAQLVREAAEAFPSQLPARST
jgi:hypothetical protein